MSHTSITVSFGIRFSKPPNVFYDLWLSLSSAHSSLWLTLRLSRERPLRLSVIEYQSTPDGEDVMGARGRIRDWETHGEPRTWIFLSPPHNSPLRGDMVTRQNISFIVFSMLFTRHTRLRNHCTWYNLRQRRLAWHSLQFDLRLHRNHRIQFLIKDRRGSQGGALPVSTQQLFKKNRAREKKISEKKTP